MGEELIVAGVDEVGRGALFGPVFAAAVVYRENRIPEGIKDSKKLTPRQRENFFEIIEKTAEDISVSFVSNFEIDEKNIQYANIKCMREAVLGLKKDFNIVYVDGYKIRDLPYEQRVIIKGDERIPVIAAASIVAKVLRDRLLIHFSRFFPEYRLYKNKGYGTREHREAVFKFGRTLFHRTSFKIN